MQTIECKLLKQDDQHIIVTNKLIIHYISTNFYIINPPLYIKPSTHVGGMADRKAGTITLAPWHFFTRSGSNISFRIASLSMRATRCEKRHVEKDSCRRLKKKHASNVCFLMSQWLLALPSYLKVPIINCNGGNHCRHTVTPQTIPQHRCQ